MSKKKSLLRLDAQIQRPAQYPDINEFLKDTQYAFQSSNYLDNQSAARLTLLLERAENLQLVEAVPVAGFVKSFYFTTTHFYGYNPDVEALQKVVLTLPVFEGFSQEFSRDNADFQFFTLSATENSIGDSLKNYRLTLSRRGVSQLIAHVFNTRAQEAFAYYSVAQTEEQQYTAEALLNYVVANLYTVAIPLTFTYYYFNSERPAFSITSSLSMRDLLTYLKEDFAPQDAVFKLSSVNENFIVDVRVRRPIVFTVKTEISNQIFQQDFTLMPAATTQQLVVSAGYEQFFTELAQQTHTDQYPSVYATYTYKPLGYSLELVEPVNLGLYVDPVTASPITVKSWFFGNYPYAVGAISTDGRLFFATEVTSKTPIAFSMLHIRADNNTDTLIDRVVPVSGYGITDAAYRNEMAELTVMTTSEALFNPQHSATIVSTLSNSNKVVRNVRYSKNFVNLRRRLRFCRLVTNVNQVDQQYDTVETLAPEKAVSTLTNFSQAYDPKTKLHTYSFLVEWLNYPEGSVYWPFLTATRIQVKLLDRLTRTVAQGSFIKDASTVYSPATTYTNPLRVSRPEANYETAYKRWFPKYSFLALNGSSTITPKALSFSASGLAQSITAAPFSSDLSKMQEVSVKLTKQSLFLNGVVSDNGLPTSVTGMLLMANTSFFTRLFFRRFGQINEQYGYLLDQAVVAVSKKVGSTTVFYQNRMPNPYLVSLDLQGSFASRGLNPLLGRFVAQETFSSIVRQVTGDTASKKISATVYLVTALHPVTDAKGKILYYSVLYDSNYKMIPGLVFTIAGAWA
jgi:hypothetical protein